MTSNSCVYIPCISFFCQTIFWLNGLEHFNILLGRLEQVTAFLNYYVGILLAKRFIRIYIPFINYFFDFYGIHLAVNDAVIVVVLPCRYHIFPGSFIILKEPWF